jgi:hypothetical protein
MEKEILVQGNYIANAVQVKKLQYEREALQYNGTHIIIGSLDGIVGNGRVCLNPEFFTLAFELRTNSSKLGIGNAKNAQIYAAEENAKVMKEFKEFLITLGVKEEDMETTKYSVEATSKTLSNAADVIHRLEVKFYIPSKIGEVYKKIESTDIKAVDEPMYDVSEKSRNEAKLLAYEYAMKDALSQAETIAKFGKFEVGDIKSIDDDDGHFSFRGGHPLYEMLKEENEIINCCRRAFVPYSEVHEVTASIEFKCSFDMIKRIK